jgi:hypothetical protein
MNDLPWFTEAQEAIEQATMTDQEKMAALTDLFGKQCEVCSHMIKRARRDLDGKSVEFLVNQMRLELERIPEDGKRALVEGQSKFHAGEFSDPRLERFLRFEGMNVRVRIEVCAYVIIPHVKMKSSLCFVTGLHAARCTAICELLGEPP